ncbi:MAG: insulinase family protein, partial [Acidobacteria bacterium]
MRARRSLLALAAVLLSCAAAQAGGLDELRARLVARTLDNGLHVTVLPLPESPVVATQMWVHVGSANEDAHSRGFAHLFEHLMFGGTAEHSKKDYWLLHEIHGGDDNAYTAFDETVYVSTIPPEGHDELLALEADRLVNLKLTEENLANEKRIVTEELRLRTENDPLARVLHRAFKEVLGEHPYGPTPIGTKEDIARADLDECRRFYRRFYNPSNVHLVIVGPVDPQRTLARVEELFGRLPGGEGPPPDVPRLVDWHYPEEVVELTDDLPPAEIAILAWPLPAPGDPDAEVVETLLAMLSGGPVDPFAEIIVRQQRHAVYSESFVYEFRRGRALILDGAFLPYHRKKTEFRWMGEAVAKLRAYLTEEKLSAAKKRLLLGEYGRAYSPEGLAA